MINLWDFISKGQSFFIISKLQVIILMGYPTFLCMGYRMGHRTGYPICHFGKKIINTFQQENHISFLKELTSRHPLWFKKEQTVLFNSLSSSTINILNIVLPPQITIIYYTLQHPNVKVLFAFCDFRGKYNIIIEKKRFKRNNTNPKKC